MFLQRGSTMLTNECKSIAEEARGVPKTGKIIRDRMKIVERYTKLAAKIDSEHFLASKD